MILYPGENGLTVVLGTPREQVNKTLVCPECGNAVSWEEVRYSAVDWNRITAHDVVPTKGPICELSLLRVDFEIELGQKRII